MSDPPLEVSIFTDFVSPHSYVTETALRAVARDRSVAIRYRALEMHPQEIPLPDIAEVGTWVSDATGHAKSDGVALAIPDFVPRTRKAHEAARFAAEHGLEGRLRDAIFRGYWDEGRDIGRIDVLAALGEEAGLERDDLRIALDIDRFADEVIRDGAIARRLKVRAVPTTYLGTGSGARILVGLQTRRGLDAALDGR